jgi:thioredoxin-like negative regulator of GroEL
MKLLETQAMFETLWTYDKNDPKAHVPEGLREDHKWIVYFTAKWCGPCRQIVVDEVDIAAEARGFTLWKCDIDVNDYTPGYCGVRTVPTFMCFEPKKIVSVLKSNNTDEIMNWISAL